LKKIIPYGRQSISESDIESVVNVLKGDYLTTGPKVKEFEVEFASYVGSKYAVAVSNGTAALHLSALALGVDKESKVITTPITFAASANCVRYCGGMVEFSDINEASLVLDIEKVRAKLESVPKGTFHGIIPVDFAGYPVNMEEFRWLADEFGLWIIEDACHAPGGFFTDKVGQRQRCGNGAFADLSVFSFHPVKHIACGEGGMITTNNKILYKKLLQLRSHGMIYQGDSSLMENHGGWYMEMQELGFNYRIPDILCALGISQLSKADKGLIRRREIAKRYDHVFKGTNVKTYNPPEDGGHAYHLYIISVSKRKELYEKLKTKGINAQIHYVPLHSMPYYQRFGNRNGDFPIAEGYYDGCISLPMYPTLSDEEQDYVIEKVLKFSK
jgi:UDP-4-amino-4,6-dideoxy-N-acetyl-beta-L-altrosamine transaminase